MNSRNKLPPPGQLVDVGGYRLHALVCGEGTPAVILESGLGGYALQFARVQPAVSAFTRVMAYDRAGQAWSDASPNPRTPVNVAAELKALLHGLDIRPPYVWVGHSFGGLLALIYAKLFSTETAGVVLIDSSDVEQYNSFPDMDKLLRQTARGVSVLKFVSRLGLGKLLTRMSLGSTAKSFPKEELDSFLDVASQPKHHDTVLAEFSQYRCYFGAQSEVPHSLGDKPLTVVTAGKSVSGRAKFGKLTADELNEQHQELQKKLTHLSSRGQHIVVPNATHLSILFQPEYAAQVVEAIRGITKR